MNFIYKTFLVALLVLPLGAVAQNEQDILRYSQLNRIGTARATAMGGAFGALGADFSTLSTNPAGLAVYRREELTFTTNWMNTATRSKFYDTTVRDNNFNLSIGNLGYVLAKSTGDTDWPKFNLAIGYNQLANFNERVNYSSNEPISTFLNRFAAQAEGTSESEIFDAFPYQAALAYETFLINPDTITGTTYTPEILTGTPKTTRGLVERSGSMGETVIAMGANYRETFFFGASLNIARVRFEEEITYTEDAFPNDDVLLDYFDYKTILNVTGSGLNGKFGLIVKPTEYLRFGAAYHTRTVLNLSENYSADITAKFVDETEVRTANSPTNNFEYNVNTPSRFVISAAGIFGKKGVLSAEYEFVDYTAGNLAKSRISGDNYDFGAENQVAQTIFDKSHLVRLGAEVRPVQMLKIRAGVRYEQSPYNQRTALSSNDLLSFSGGIGFRKNGFFADLAYVQTAQKQEFYPDNTDFVDPLAINRSRGMAVITIGLRYE